MCACKCAVLSSLYKHTSHEKYVLASVQCYQACIHTLHMRNVCLQVCSAIKLVYSHTSHEKCVLACADVQCWFLFTIFTLFSSAAQFTPATAICQPLCSHPGRNPRPHPWHLSAAHTSYTWPGNRDSTSRPRPPQTGQR